MARLFMTAPGIGAVIALSVASTYWKYEVTLLMPIVMWT